MPNGIDTADAIVVGAGLAGLVATAELADAGRKVILVDQEPEASLGGQAFWSLGGLMLVDSPEQRRLRIRDSHELAWQDWLGTRRLRPPGGRMAAALGRGLRRLRGRREARVAAPRRASGSCPTSRWAERGGYLATGHGNSVPRFHITWGTGPGVLEPFDAAGARGAGARPRRAALPPQGRRADAERRRGDRASAASGSSPAACAAAQKSSRTAVGEFALEAPVVIVTSGGIGANHELVRANWPQRLGDAAEAT